MKINSKIIKLFTNRGFYILLALGIGVVSVMGYVNNLRSKKTYDMPVISTFSEPDTVASTISNVPAVSYVNEVDEPAPKSVAVAAVANTNAEAEAEKEIKLIIPLQGELGMVFSGDELVFNRTMQDWRVHTGVDIRADIGTPVKAAEDGIVTNVYSDYMMGLTVVIQHANGIETVYSNLQTGELVEINQEVYRGDTIGGVGMTAASEISEPPHLHFEVKKDGEFVNPFDYFK